jgi:chromosome segregation ATPase
MSDNAENKNLSNDVSHDDIERVKLLRTKYATVTAQIGQVEVELHITKKRIEDVSKLRETLLQTYIDLQKEEEDLVKELNNKYGDGVLDLEENKFVPSKES